MSLKAYDIYLNKEWIDRVFDEEEDPQEVKRSLVNHDGYDPAIVVKRGGRLIPSKGASK